MSLPEIATIIHSKWKTVSISQKSSEKAQKLKELGNSQFKDKLLSEALLSYTKAIFLAPWPQSILQKTVHEHLQTLQDSKLLLAKSIHFQYLQSRKVDSASEPLLAFCFGNRSAVFYELGRIEECLLDIERAMSFGYPQSSIHKLQRRKTNCLAKLKGKDKNGSSNQDNEKLFSAFESEYVDIKSSPDVGRYVIVTCDVNPGEVVVYEEPYAAILEGKFMHSYCSHCFKECTTLIPCCLCCSEGYCSSKCRGIAWERYHWFECTTSYIWKRVDWMLQLCLRIVLRVDPEELSQTLSGHPSDPLSGGYGSVYSLLTHEDKYTDDAQRTLMERLSDIVTQCYGEPIIGYLGVKEKSTPSSTQSKETLTSQKRSSKTESKSQPSALRCITHFITALVSSESDSGPGDSSTKIESVREVNIGSAVYPTASLFNHSCFPNAILRFTDNNVAVRVVEKTTLGNELCISYGPQVGRMNRQQRQEELKQKYFFQCKCVACSRLDSDLNYAETVMDALLCPKCESGPVKVLKLDSEEKCSSEPCLECGHVTSEVELKERLMAREKARASFRASNSQSDTFTLLKCKKIQEKCLHKYNLELAETYDKLAHAYTIQHDYSSASRYCELSCQAVCVVYGGRSIEASGELCKLAELLTHTHNIDAALKSVKLSLDIMQIYHKPDHPDYVQAVKLKELLQTLPRRK